MASAGKMKKSKKPHLLSLNSMHHVSLRVHDMERWLAFFRGPDGELIKRLEDKTGYT